MAIFYICSNFNRFNLSNPNGLAVGRRLLAAAGFSDFAGSTLVHATGAAAALAGAIVLGPRLGRFASKSDKPMPGFANSSIPLVTIGVFILWFGWF